MQKTILWVLTILCVLLGFDIFSGYLTQHTYYLDMFKMGSNWGMIVIGLLAVAIPLLYLLFHQKKTKLGKFGIYFVLGLLFFAVATTLIKGDLIGGGLIMLLINNLLLLFIGCIFFVGILAFGTWISNLCFKLKQTRWQEMLLNFGLGLGIFLFIVQIFWALGWMYPIVAWILLGVLIFMIWYQRTSLREYKKITEDILDLFTMDNLKKNGWNWILLLLLAISVLYFFYGFQNSFIPYPTAWDANHEYMYIPKVLSDNHGVLWGNTGPGGGMPSLWHAFIGYFFSLKTWMGGSTLATVMNFWSGIFVLIFGLGLVRQIMSLFQKKASKKEEDKNENQTSLSNKVTTLVLGTGWMTLLLWLTSGMGVFLVFVDNKTDLGVMSLGLLALLAGCIFLGYLKDNSESKKEIWKYLLLAGIFFGMAALAKITAFVDALLFGLFLLSFWFNGWIGVGFGMMSMGILRKMNILTSSTMVTPDRANWFLIIGAVIAVCGIIWLLIKERKNLKKVGTAFSYLAIRGLTFVITLVLFKGPRVLTSQVISDNFSPKTFVSRLFAQVNVEKIKDEKNQTSKLLFAQNTSSGALDETGIISDVSVGEQSISEQTLVDLQYLSQQEPASLSLEQCKSQNYSKEELEEGLQKMYGDGLSEDVGRYIGYGWEPFYSKEKEKELGKDKFFDFGIAYTFLKMFFPGEGNCYGIDPEAKILCENAGAIQNFDVKTLRNIYETQIQDSSGEVAKLLSGALAAFDASGYKEGSSFNPQTFRDHIVALRQYYESHAIGTDDGVIYIPYRYLIPANIVFNRSLQNHSSYYTDIGFVWLLFMMLIIFSLVYGLIRKNKLLLSISLTTILGWIIWWIIGGAILWYGTVLIAWTVITLVSFVQALFAYDKNEKEKTLTEIFFGVLLICFLIQIVFNFIRISSQGASGPFVRYKSGVGTTSTITDELAQSPKTDYRYDWKDVFDLQFPQYNPFLEYVDGRANEDGILVAGTYLQYFLNNHWNVRLDGLLSWLWQEMSDFDPCKSYQRLKDENIKYLVIDPNIGTVGMGEGNETLLHRFLAKFDPVTGKIDQDGAISMLVKLYEAGYLKGIGSNNLALKYAFDLTNNELRQFFGNIADEELSLIRTKLAGIRYMGSEADQLANVVANIFQTRMSNGKAIGDLADIYGQPIDEKNVFSAANLLMGNANATAKQQAVSNLTQSERLILLWYVSLYQTFASGNTQSIQASLQDIIGQSLGGSTQLATFELL